MCELHDDDMYLSEIWCTNTVCWGTGALFMDAEYWLEKSKSVLVELRVNYCTTAACLLRQQHAFQPSLDLP